MPNSSRRTIDNPAIEAAQLLARLGIFLLFVISQLAPIVVRQTAYILLPVGAALLLASAGLTPQAYKSRPLRDLLLSSPVIAALLLVAWTGLSLFWTPFGDGPGERFAKSSATLALVAIACGYLPARTKTSNLNLLPIGAGVAALTLVGAAIYTRPTGQTVEDILDVGPFARAGLGLALLVWPAMGALAVRDRIMFAGALGVATAAACVLAKAPNAVPALIVGGAVLALSLNNARRVARYYAYASVVIVLLAPFAALAAHFIWGGHAPALLRPLSVWGHIVANDGARALVGHGFGSAMYGVLGGYLDPGQPRSLLFEVWFDLGIVGALALAGVSARAFVLMARTRAALAPFLLAGLAAGLTICIVGPAAEQLWWFTFAGLDAIAYVLVIRGQFRKRRPRVPVTAPLEPAV